MAQSGSLTRRRYLAGLGTATVGSVTGCLDSTSGTVDVLSAGSLATTFGDHVGPAFEDKTGITIHGEYYGTNAVVRMIEDETKYPDVIVSADATLLRERLYGEYADWDLEFATNSLGIGYNPETTFGGRIEAGEPWYEVAMDFEAGKLAISDPDLDPLGYRAIQAFELAEREHGIDGFREEMQEKVYTEPEEPQLLAGVETGSRVGAVVYHNMAVDHGMPFVEFPEVYNFANPDLADHYARVTYTTDDGYTAPGRPILYNLTVRDGAGNPEAGRKLVQYVVNNPETLREAGLTVTESLPRPNGEFPEGIEV